jgi:hypothetical protein
VNSVGLGERRKAAVIIFAFEDVNPLVDQPMTLVSVIDAVLIEYPHFCEEITITGPRREAKFVVPFQSKVGHPV